MASGTSVCHPEHICNELLPVASPSRQGPCLWHFLFKHLVFLEKSSFLLVCPETTKSFSPSESCHPGCSAQTESKGRELFPVWHKVKCAKIWYCDPWVNHRIASALALKLCCRP